MHVKPQLVFQSIQSYYVPLRYSLNNFKNTDDLIKGGKNFNDVTSSAAIHWPTRLTFVSFFVKTTPVKYKSCRHDQK